jgi:DNA invertase Pin-like site-specific DNA recombinase
MTTAVYARISDDRKDGVGVENQIRKCLEWCVVEGWAPVAVYRDDGVSASVYASKPRKAYRDLLRAVEAGNVERIVCFATDRLYRQPRELEVLIPLAERVEVRSKIGGIIDLSTAGGRLNARIQVGLAANESDIKSERTRLSQQGKRDRGDPHGGPRPFGWLALEGHPSWDPRQHDPVEAALIRQAVDDVLAGAGVNEIARRWTAAGVKQPRGVLGWHPATIRSLLTSPRNAALVTYGGDVVREGNWPPIIDRERFERICAELDQRGSRFSPVRRRRTLLSGVLVCGLCGSLLMHGGSGPRERRDGSRKPSAKVYRCKKGPGATGCGCMQIAAEPLERDVTEALLAYLDREDLAALAGATESGEASTLTRELAELDRDARETADLAAGGKIRPADFARYSSGVDGRRQALRQRLARLSSTSALEPYAGKVGALRAAWPSLSDDQRRSLIAGAFGRLTVRARVKGEYGYDFARVRAERGAKVPSSL